ncbi:hypothetical protein E4U55_003230 [Claviceps digitariae]|nr:hypothetical protein E4U55_003230 [Claviceps digitariae]
MTSESAQRANLARIRDNQRRSRARRREYLQELEQRLRACELQGIEATAEVQMAARKVADENTKLRELLHKYGATDDYIAQCLQEDAGIQTNCNSEQGHNAQVMDAQSLQQLMLPRRAAHLEPSAQFPLPSQSSREASIASGSTMTSSAWKCSPPTMAHYSHQPQQLGVSPSTTTMGSSDHQAYSSAVFHAQPASTQPDLFQSPRSEHLMNDAHQSLTAPQPLPIDDRSVMNYHFPLNPIHDEAHHHEPHRI